MFSDLLGQTERATYHIFGQRIVVMGVVKTGKVSVGMKATINGKNTEVLSIEASNKKLETVEKGQHCGLIIKGIKEEDIEIGQEIQFNL